MPFDPWTMVASGATAAVNTGLDIATAGIRRNQQLKTQKASLEQQNAAAMDMWEKTGYGAQKNQMKEAGINPALLYGMSGGGGQSTGQATGQVPEAQTQVHGMDIAGAAQLRLIEAQAAKLEAETRGLNTQADYTAGALTGKTRAEIPKVQAETGKIDAEKVKIGLESDMQKILNNIKDSTQWYDIGKAEQEWLKLTQETRSAAAKADVDQSTIENDIRMKGAQLATEFLKQTAMRAGVKLTEQQVRESGAKIIEMMRNAESNNQNSITNMENKNLGGQRLAWDKQMNDVAESMQIPIDVVKGVLQAFGIGGAMKQMVSPGRTVIQGFQK